MLMMMAGNDYRAAGISKFWHVIQRRMLTHNEVHQAYTLYELVEDYYQIPATAQTPDVWVYKSRLLSLHDGFYLRDVFFTAHLKAGFTAKQLNLDGNEAHQLLLNAAKATLSLSR